MPTLTAHRLEFTLQAVTSVQLNEHQGAALRGALYHGLRGEGGWGGFCAQKHLQSCADCSLVAACPVATLVSTLDPNGERGRDLPRPYVIDPPLDGRTHFEPGEKLTFGLTILARALQLFPYVILALRALEELGLGKRVPGAGWRRGRARLLQAVATNPLTGANQPVLRQGEQMVQVPDVPITHQQVLAAAAQLPAARLGLDFLTPTRLVEEGHLLKVPEFGPLFHRLWRRVADLGRAFADATPDEAEGYRLVGLARQVRLVEDGTRWVELESYSTRQRRAMPISGFVGPAVYEGDLASFLPWLVWGQFTHVGKDAVKGNGWYGISCAQVTTVPL